MKSFSEKSKIILPVNIFSDGFLLTVFSQKYQLKLYCLISTMQPLYFFTDQSDSRRNNRTFISKPAVGFSIQMLNAIGFVPQDFPEELYIPTA